MRIINNNLVTSVLCLLLMGMSLNSNCQGNRPIDGFGTNQLHKEWGAKGTNQLHLTPLGFSDGISEPGGIERPNPREISNIIFNQEGILPDAMGLSDYAWVWGQFIDHDITLSPEDPAQPMSILIPAGDQFFDPDNTGVVAIHTQRSAYDPNTGTDSENPRRFPNQITSFIDGSGVYGSDGVRANHLRKFRYGKLKMSSGNMLPYNTLDGEYDSAIDAKAPEMAMANPHISKWYVAGDVRANENPFLTSIHTLFVREHNRVVDQLMVDNPYWTDEQLYQKARKIVGGLIQSIVFEEFLPTLGVQLSPYSGYDENVNPGIMNVFSTAAYRYGHTVINSTLLRMDNDGNIIPEGNLQLKDAFFNPPMLEEGGGLTPLFNGMAAQVEQEFDTKMIHDLRNFLFGPPGSGGLDLAALNINRARERGITDYNSVRMYFGLKAKESFDQITSNRELSGLMENLYGDVNNIDPWVGFLAEDHMSNTLFGETVMKIMEIQFTNLRDGDRFYYENDSGLSSAEIDEIKNTRLADVIRRNSNVKGIQDDVFVARDHSTVATNDIVREGLGIKAYPNPGNGRFRLSFNALESGDAMIQTYNAYGNLVVNRNVLVSHGKNEFEIELGNDMPAGLYHARIIMGKVMGNTMVIKSDQ